MNVNHIFVMVFTGVMNFKRIMKYEFVIGVMLSIVAIAMKWINAMTAEKLFVRLALPC